MFKIYYAGKRSLPETNQLRTMRTIHGHKMVDLQMGYDFFLEQGHTLDLDETHTYLCTTTLDDPEQIFASFQGEYANEDMREAVQEADATHTSMSIGDVLVGHGKTLIVDRFGFTEVN